MNKVIITKPINVYLFLAKNRIRMIDKFYIRTAIVGTNSRRIGKIGKETAMLISNMGLNVVVSSRTHRAVYTFSKLSSNI